MASGCRQDRAVRRSILTPLRRGQARNLAPKTCQALPLLVPHPARLTGMRAEVCQKAKTAATGTWSEGFSQLRTCFSIDAESRRSLASGESIR